MRRNSFDLVRLLAAALVLYAHSFAVLGFDQPRILGGTVGLLGVEIFFATSGYLIAASWRRTPRLSAFVWKRGLRLLPALVPLALVLVVVAQLDLFDGNPRSDLNPSLWSLPIEVRCYLMVALLGVAGALRKPPAVLALFVLLVLMMTWDYYPQGPVIGNREGFVTSPQVLTAAFVGGVLMHWIPRRPLFAVGAVALLAGISMSPEHLPHYGVIWALAVPYIVICGAERFTVRLRHDLSYGLYIWGWPVQQAIVTLGLTQPVVIFPLALIGASALAAGSWFAVERPALRLKGAVLRSRSQSIAA